MYSRWLKTKEALWILLFQGDFSDRARCNFISRRRRKWLEKLEIGKNSIDRSIGRETRTPPIIVSFVGHEYATKNMHTRGNTRFARANIWLRSRLPSKIPAASDFRKYIFIERGGRFHEFLRKKRWRNIFSRLPSTSRANIEKYCLFPGRKQSRYRLL